MLKNIIVVSSSGLVLFSKEYETSVSQPRLIGSLLTAITEFSKNVAGMPVSYIQLKGVAVTIVATFDISCAIFHDPTDGPEFGKLIATQILSTFISTYSKDLRNNIGTNLKDFEDFQFKIPEAIRSAIAPTLAKLQDCRGIQLAVLVTSDSQVTYTTKDIDQIGFKANLQALKSVANDIMTAAGDTANQVWLDPTPSVRILVQRMSNKQGTLVVKCTNNRPNVEFAKCQEAINEAILTLNNVRFLMSGMEVSTR
jgi:hypothetical protein